MAHAALRAAAGALALVATVLRSMFRPTRAIQILVFKDGHPNLVRLPPPIRTGFSTVSGRCHPVTLALAGPRSAEADEHRASGAPSRTSVSPQCRVPPTARLESSRPPCGVTERRPDSGAPSTSTPRVDGRARAFARLDPRIRPKASAILTTHGHARRSSRLPTA